MKRLVGLLLGILLVVVVLFLPAVFYAIDTGDDTPSEPTSISRYVGDFDVADDGDMEVVETIAVDFPTGDRHGIFRFFDKRDANDDGARWVPRDISVTMDGGDVPVSIESRERGRYVVAKIGDPDRYVPPGEHVYEIHYVIDGVLRGADGLTGKAETQLYWNLIPPGWLQTIADAQLTVHLPAPSVEEQCVVGKNGPCDVLGGGTDTIVVRAEDLPAQTPVTVKLGLDMPTPPPGKTLPWPGSLDPILGSGLGIFGVVLALSAAAGLLGFVLARRTREAEPGFPLMYAPPEGIGPAQAAYLLTEDVDDMQYVATLMYAAEKGAIDLDHSGHTWTISDKNGAAGWAGLDPVTGGIAQLLTGPGTSFVAARDVESGKRLQSELENFEERTEDWAATSGLMTGSGLGGAGCLVVGACLLVVLVVAIWNPFDMTIIGLVPGLFAVLGAGLAATGAGTKRTPRGRDLWSRAGGFRRILATPSAQDRFDFSGREELYTAYIPWAVAFGCADEWAEKYRVEVGSEPPVPAYFGHAYAGSYTGSAASEMASDFNATVSSAISSYEATQSSSSSGGGGGFSGGGGGGGGGGGSW